MEDNTGAAKQLYLFYFDILADIINEAPDILVELPLILFIDFHH